MRGGPEWGEIVGRVAVDADTGGVLVAEDLRGVGRIDLHRPITVVARDVITGIIYTE